MLGLSRHSIRPASPGQDDHVNQPHHLNQPLDINQPHNTNRQDHTNQHDAGVVAIIVALAMSTFLLGFAALAVDMGSAYTRKAEMQSIADRLALAGAAGLPTIQGPGGAIDRMTRTLTEMCKESATPGLCQPDGTALPFGWATDGNQANGQVNFLVNSDGDGRYRLGEKVASLADPSTALEISLPPSTVQFGLAGVFGYSSVQIHRSATARIGTPLGSGILPFELTPQDLTAGQFCVQAAPTAAPPAPPVQPVYAIQTSPVYLSTDVPPVPEVDISLSTTPPPTITVPANLASVQFRLSDPPNTNLGKGGGQGVYTAVQLPASATPGSTTSIYAKGTRGGTPFTTDPIPIVYSATPGADLCSQPEANRGFVNLARLGSDTDLVNFEDDVRSGPVVRMYDAAGPFGLPTPDPQCVSFVFAPATSCLELMTGVPFQDELTNGLLGAGAGGLPGRLIGSCGQGTMVSQDVDGVDASDLLTDPGFLDVSHGTSTALLARLVPPSQPGTPAATADDQGWITSKALRCPRMAVLPVVDPADATHKITGFRYVWIDDFNDSTHRGLNGDLGKVTSLRGYIIDPGYLPSLVAGSRVVGPFLGTDMPKEALLMHDLGQ